MITRTIEMRENRLFRIAASFLVNSHYLRGCRGISSRMKADRALQLLLDLAGCLDSPFLESYVRNRNTIRTINQKYSTLLVQKLVQKDLGYAVRNAEII